MNRKNGGTDDEKEEKLQKKSKIERWIKGTVKRKRGQAKYRIRSEKEDESEDERSITRS